ncbi:MAG: hypothetical protein MSH47_03115 [Bacteroidales bacterium]|nr:hypothetical protein [Bacteroidales bacterium]
MNDKLQELTDKIYLEGVEKGKNEAKEIVSKASEDAEKIIAKAKADAEKILADAEKQAKELEKNTKSELKLYTDQSLNALKSEITNIISEKVASIAVNSALNDKQFMQSIISDIASKWISNGEVVIEAKDAKSLEDYFMANAKELLNKCVTIKEVKGLKTDFTISPVNNGYKVAFGENEFIEYFKDFLRPKLVDMLFN